MKRSLAVVIQQQNQIIRRCKVGVENLADAVPQLKRHCSEGEQVVNIGLQDMNDEVWLTLAKINTECDKTTVL